MLGVQRVHRSCWPHRKNGTDQPTSDVPEPLLTTLRAVLRRSAENFCLRLSYQDRNCNKGTNFSPLVAQLVQVGFDDCIVAGSNATQEF